MAMQPTEPIAETEAPTAAPEPGGAADTILVRVSHYWPPLGGTNCSWYANGQCVARMANGERWQDHVGRAAACPREYPFGTRFELPDGSEWICKDRGGAIVTSGGASWIDLLVEQTQYAYGEVVEAKVRLP